MWRSSRGLQVPVIAHRLIQDSPANLRELDGVISPKLLLRGTEKAPQRTPGGLRCQVLTDVRLLQMDDAQMRPGTQSFSQPGCRKAECHRLSWHASGRHMKAHSLPSHQKSDSQWSSVRISSAKDGW